MIVMQNVTLILQQMESGNAAAAEQLLPLVYEELRQLAAARLAEEKPGQTLQATALVHEAYVRLVEQPQLQNWENRRHFFGAAAEAMRRILVDRARRRNCGKHGAQLTRVALDPEELSESVTDDHLLTTLDEALARFHQVDPVACELVKLRYFGGLTLHAAGELLELAPRSADRLWAYSKAWLLRELQRENDSST